MMLVSIDIGSTWTKGALFRLTNSELSLIYRTALPTSVDNLADAFYAVLEALVSNPIVAQVSDGRDVKLYYSSSAKGGLSVAALGIVPEITLETAKVAAQSAGAKLTRVLSYRLTRSDIALLEREQPDILLFAGGTDGGNSDYVLSNAQALAKSKLTCSIVYAGNRSVHDEVTQLLEHKDCTAVDNLLPDIDSPNPGPAREAIRNIFLSKIVKGKGLDVIIERTGTKPLPTPYAVYEFAKQIRRHVPGWSEFLLVDMGGATTDVYSAHRESPSGGTVLRGLPEPDVKRTVEGDLGLRVSAVAAVQSARQLIDSSLDQQGCSQSDFANYIDRIGRDPEHLATDDADRTFDSVLAGACLAHACSRHAGRSSEVYTPDGMVRVQKGRDLTQVFKLIGSGGWLSKNENFDPRPWLASVQIDAKGRSVLVPSQVEYYQDHDYLIPLLANFAQDYPAIAARAAVAALIQH